MPKSKWPLCAGTGWKIVQREEVSGAERRTCFHASRGARIEAAAGIPPLYQNALIDSFKLPDENPVARSALANVMLTVRAFVREFPNDKRPALLITGEPGTGRTHLAVAALHMLIARGFEGFFFDYQTLRLFEMCRVIRTPAVENYRLQRSARY